MENIKVNTIIRSYHLERCIYKNSDSKIFIATKDSSVYALKVMKFDINTGPIISNELKYEEDYNYNAYIICSLKFDFMLRIHNYFYENGLFFVFLEYVHNELFMSYIIHNEFDILSKYRPIMKKIVRFLLYCHHHNRILIDAIIYRDGPFRRVQLRFPYHQYHPVNNRRSLLNSFRYTYGSPLLVRPNIHSSRKTPMAVPLRVLQKGRYRK
ncbi:hypothetical protein TRFO_31043 [Tritrichomonas foetus]|uniref:Protein kinase domain-containing protein n=1 Tax=Tritrichomonas foetus TaxID=1144522 RepID=A0A1J4JSE5_9EUKA|nr:hypothetical protein TRFO_31043 [Tritrichomonas foetus]|eukprot:OHT01971.1 hypothetical protein TRFO_31043 [Tritrichomonas foetus]